MKNEGVADLRGMGVDDRASLLMSLISELTLKPAFKPRNIKALAEVAFEVALIVLKEAENWPASPDGFMSCALSSPRASRLRLGAGRGKVPPCQARGKTPDPHGLVVRGGRLRQVPLKLDNKQALLTISSSLDPSC